MTNRLPIYFTTRAKKDLKKIRKKDKKLYTKIENVLHLITENPNHGSLKSGDLKDVYSIDIYNAGINYELAYRIEYDDKGDAVIVLLFGTREKSYNELKRYLNP